MTNLIPGKLYKTLCPITFDALPYRGWRSVEEETIIMYISTIKLDVDSYKHTILLVQNGNLYSRSLPPEYFEDWVEELK